MLAKERTTSRHCARIAKSRKKRSTTRRSVAALAGATSISAPAARRCLASRTEKDSGWARTLRDRPDSLMLQAICHCGDVRIDIARRPQALTQCTCSICRRYGAQWAYYTRRSVTVHADPATVSAYVWGDRTIEFFHCNRCGCVTHYESVEKDIDSRIAVNARMLPAEDVAGIRVRTFDGAKTWKYIDD